MLDFKDAMDQSIPELKISVTVKNQWKKLIDHFLNLLSNLWKFEFPWHFNEIRFTIFLYPI